MMRENVKGVLVLWNAEQVPFILRDKPGKRPSCSEAKGKIK